MAGGAKLGGDDDGVISDINVTPLVDIVLVLLIILMVTATAIVSKTIPMDLPKAATGEQAPAALAVSIDSAGNLFLDRDPVNADQLRQRVRDARSRDPEVRAIIAADGKIQYSNVIQVIDLLRQEQVTRFAINVQPDEIAR